MNNLIRLEPDMELVFRPIEINYKKDIYRSLYNAINRDFIVDKKYKIREIWHKDGYHLYGDCSNTPNVPRHQKVWFWSGKIVPFLSSASFIVRISSFHPKNLSKESIIVIKNLTIPERVIRDNFVNVKLERKLKLKKINLIDDKNNSGVPRGLGTIRIQQEI